MRDKEVLDKEIAEGNILIAEFDGWKSSMFNSLTGDKYLILEKEGHQRVRHSRADIDFKYYETWDALMPVVEKIESLAIDNVGEPYFVIMPNQCEVREGNDVILSTRKTTTKIIMTWLAVVEFIKWYNQQSK